MYSQDGQRLQSGRAVYCDSKRRERRLRRFEPSESERQACGRPLPHGQRLGGQRNRAMDVELLRLWQRIVIVFMYRLFGNPGQRYVRRVQQFDANLSSGDRALRNRYRVFSQWKRTMVMVLHRDEWRRERKLRGQ